MPQHSDRTLIAAIYKPTASIYLNGEYVGIASRPFMFFCRKSKREPNTLLCDHYTAQFEGHAAQLLRDYITGTLKTGLISCHIAICDL